MPGRKTKASAGFKAGVKLRSKRQLLADARRLTEAITKAQDMLHVIQDEIQFRSEADAHGD